MVEFSFAVTLFLLIVFGTVDFGRVIFTYSQLLHGVREGARYGKVECGRPGWIDATKDRVIAQSPTLGLLAADIDVATSTAGCVPLDGTVRVTASTEFTAVTQTLLGIGPIDLRASATVDVE